MDNFKEHSLKRSRYDQYYNDGVDQYKGKDRKIVNRIVRSGVKKETRKQIKEAFSNDIAYDKLESDQHDLLDSLYGDN